MSIDPSYDLFGLAPTSVILQSSADFDGTAYASDVAPTKEPGCLAFPVQAGGGYIPALYHPVKVLSVTTTTVGVTLSGKLVLGSSEVVLDLENPFIIPAGAHAEISSTGGSGTRDLVVTGHEVVGGCSL